MQTKQQLIEGKEQHLRLRVMQMHQQVTVTQMQVCIPFLHHQGEQDKCFS